MGNLKFDLALLLLKKVPKFVGKFYQQLQIIYFLIVLLCVLGCTSDINSDNFTKIKSGMSLNEVVTLLGEPSSSATISFKTATSTSADWQSHHYTIRILFFDGKVKLKEFIKKTYPRQEPT